MYKMVRLSADFSIVHAFGHKNTQAEICPIIKNNHLAEIINQTNLRILFNPCTQVSSK